MTNPDLTNEQVAAFLRNNEEFFVQRPDLLELLRLPSPNTGNSVSLLERQAEVLRDRNQELRGRLNSLVEIARDNDRLFEKTRRLVLDMLDANNMAGLITSLIKGLEREFSPDNISLLLYSDIAIPAELNAYARHLPQFELHEALQVMLNSNRAVCGILRPKELEQLFSAEQADQIKSAAMVPLYRHRQLGLLAIGSHSVNHFKSSLDTLFISHLGEVASRRMVEFLPTLTVSAEDARA